MQRWNIESLSSAGGVADSRAAVAPSVDATPETTEPVAGTGLELLNRALLGLLTEPDTRRPLLELLQRLEDRTGIGPCAVFAQEQPMAPLTLLASTDPEVAEAMRKAVAQASRHGRLAPSHVRAQPGIATREFRLHVLKRGEHHCGWLVVNAGRGLQAAPGGAPLLTFVAERLGDVVGAAMHAARTRRHHLHEERASIARELHDSLAQSLSYLKIQVARLHARTRERQAPDPAPAEDASAVVDELRASLNVAYRQLRELIATFRLTMNGRTLGQALEDSIEEFQRRSAIVFELDDRLDGNLLDAEEEIQVLQIAREALSNVVRHSHARRAWLSLREVGTRDVLLSVRDDGVGLDTGHHGDLHHGLIIMQERARTLGGMLSVGPATDGGTMVQVRFTPRRRAGQSEV